ncbi:MAG: excinuclease ABC subunit A, partial [Muribaculaceae bacterium]|nr:excinuclease ABC subunit A [Muribaculaceae bacterium]
PEGRDFATQLEVYLKAGYSRVVDSKGEFISIEDLMGKKGVKAGDYMLLIDRLSIQDNKDEISRLRESVETAFFEGSDSLVLLAYVGDGEIERGEFSRKFEADGITFMEPSDLLFNFNNPFGACPRCEGFGNTLGIDERLVIPNPAVSVYEDAVACWRGEKMGEWKNQLISKARTLNFPIHKPYCDLTAQEKDILWNGSGSFTGINGFFKMVEENLYKVQYRVLQARYRGRTLCPECHGTRLRKEALYVKVNDMTIADLVKMPVTELITWFNGLSLTEQEQKIGKRILTEIRTRLQFLSDVGLGYLTLDRLSSTLSGGESQRINLATSLGSSLVGSIYILDEPSIGLHP